jgi:hypothetical protein
MGDTGTRAIVLVWDLRALCGEYAAPGLKAQGSILKDQRSI